jgi:hypothetical protein
MFCKNEMLFSKSLICRFGYGSTFAYFKGGVVTTSLVAILYSQELLVAINKN